MAENDDELSYEVISEIRRKEENSSFLSQVRPDFYTAANSMIRKNTEARNKILVENPDMYDGISGRYRNVAALLERVIFIRTDKIWHSALRDASAGSPKMPENLTAEEKELYSTLYGVARAQFTSVSGNKASFTPKIDEMPVAEKPPVEVPAENEASPPAAEQVPETVVAEEPVEESKVYELPAVEPADDLIVRGEEVLVRMLDDVPTFSGPERDYTLKKEDVVRLPSMMASALVNRHKAVLIKTAE